MHHGEKRRRLDRLLRAACRADAEWWLAIQRMTNSEREAVSEELFGKPSALIVQELSKATVLTIKRCQKRRAPEWGPAEGETWHEVESALAYCRAWIEALRTYEGAAGHWIRKINIPAMEKAVAKLETARDRLSVRVEEEAPA